MALKAADTDETLMEAWRAGGDREALEALFVRLTPFALSVARSAGRAQTAEDAVQDAFMQVLAISRDSAPIGQVRPWLARVVLNSAMARSGSDLRRRRREERAALLRNSERPAEAELEHAETQRELAAAMEELPPGERVAVVLHYRHGLSQGEVAEVLGTYQRAVSRTLKQALEKLRRSMTAAGRSMTGGTLAVLIGSLPEEPVSTALGTKVTELAQSGSAETAASAGTSQAAAAGGASLKLVAGLVIAGVIAGAAAVAPGLLQERGATPPPVAAAGPNAPTGKPKREHFAFSSNLDYLDGPRLEAMGDEKGRMSNNDRDGNWYFTWNYSTSWIRRARADGMMETIAGDDRWTPNFSLEEGPAVCFPNFGMGPVAGNNCKAGYDMTVYGSPQDENDQVRIYLFWPDQSPYVIFRNREKDGRWWFRRVGTPGKPKPPQTVGQSASVDETDLTDAEIGIGTIVWQGNLYAFDEAKREITCLLTVADYASKVKEMVGKAAGGKGLGPAEYLARAADGTFYVLYYWKLYPSGHLFRVSPDRSKIEHIAADDRAIPGSGTDGPALHTKWPCGPGRIEMAGDVPVLHSVDGTTVRRYKDGRVSSLCYDGEWREVGSSEKLPALPVMCKGFNVAAWGLNCINFFYPGEENGGDNRCYTFGPVDFEKPTVGSLVQEAAGQKGGQQ